MPTLLRAVRSRTPRAGSVRALAERHAWVVLLVLGFAMTAVVASASPAVSALAAATCGLLSVAAIVVGVRRHRPSRASAWAALAGGLGLYWAVAAPSLAGLWDPTALPVMVATVAGYIGLMFGVVGILSDDGGDGDISTMLEALILAAAAALVVWFIVVAQVRDAGREAAFGDTLGALAYPALDLAMFALAGRTVMRYRRIGASLWLLLPALLGSAASDFAGLVQFATGAMPPPWLATGGSLLASAFVGAAALHPSLARPLLSHARPLARFLRVRVGLVGAATLIAPAMMLIYESQAAATGLRVETTEVALGAIVISALVVADLTFLLVRLDGSLNTRVALEGELKRRALSDSLTELPNRAAFIGRLEGQFEADRHAVALLFCDLDDFKTVNDTLGHAAGDDLLVEVGKRLRRAIRPADLAARLGGDEFAILLGGLARSDDAERVATRILDAFTEPFAVAGEEFTVRISIGIAFGAESDDPADLMRDADVAMYVAKEHGKGRFERFRPDARSTSTRRLTERAGLEHAIASGGLSLAFQPVRALSGGAIVGVEALARWVHPHRGTIPPSDFIPLAEQTGLIVPLGRWVLEAACVQMRSWLDAGADQEVSLFVNVSAVQVARGDFAAELASVLQRSGLPPGNLVLEITESAVLDTAEAVATFEVIRALGVRVAIDDFGTGYSSISYLGRFPIDILKIDRSFVASLGDGGRGDALVPMILAVAASLSLMPVAEGIETEAQRQALIAMGCPVGQGYLLARPGSPEQTRRLLVPVAAGADLPAVTSPGFA